jgi:hypothetical protein
MATKRDELEWREIIKDFDSYGHQNPAVFYVARDVHAHDLKQKQVELKKNSFIPVALVDSEVSKPIASLKLPSGVRVEILSLSALMHLVETATI